MGRTPQTRVCQANLRTLVPSAARGHGRYGEAHGHGPITTADVDGDRAPPIAVNTYVELNSRGTRRARKNGRNPNCLQIDNVDRAQKHLAQNAAVVPPPGPRAASCDRSPGGWEVRWAPTVIRPHDESVESWSQVPKPKLKREVRTGMLADQA